MANSRTLNVQYVDTTADFSHVTAIEGILYIGSGATSSITIVSITGTLPVWEATGASRIFDDVCVQGNKGIRVTVANGARAYIYHR